MAIRRCDGCLGELDAVLDAVQPNDLTHNIPECRELARRRFLGLLETRQQHPPATPTRSAARQAAVDALLADRAAGPALARKPPARVTWIDQGLQELAGLSAQDSANLNTRREDDLVLRAALQRPDTTRPWN